jgi:exodeoxyribonuclease V beta subunit
MNKLHFITDPSEIDLSRHALIEASAGTGKTYTIENLVVRLIEDRSDIRIENILLVTFTEKAAGELKVRIREKIQQQYSAYKKASGLKVHKFKEALDNFDQTPVFTIHGFCQNLLTELAFENNALFENELKEDRLLYESLLKDLMRQIWPTRYGDHLFELLQLCQFADDKDNLLRKIIHISRNLSYAAKDRLIPQSEYDSYRHIRTRLEAKAAHLAKLLAGPPMFSKSYARLNINARTRNSLIEKIIRPMELFFLHQTEKNLNIGGLGSLFKALNQVTSRQNIGLTALLPEKWLKTGPNVHVCPNLEQIVLTALELEKLTLVGTHWIVRETIFDLKDEVTQTKQQHGWISFDDMLEQVYGALNLNTSTPLLERIREKYKIAFVDEFQDTDPIQWHIFSRIFIDDSKQRKCHPLIIIGDPKQAIYSFRGADVYAYLEARAVFTKLALKGQANLYSLCQNWRSLPELVDGFNQLFSNKNWFPPKTTADEFEIGYYEAISPGKEQLSFCIVEDNTRLGSLNIVDLQSLSTIGLARKALGGYIAFEINRLVVDKPLWLKSKGDRKRPIDYGDICILIRNKSEAKSLEADLIKAAIPYSFYKKPGLFQSEQAEVLSLMLHAIIDPGNVDKIKKALLTPFFDVDPSFLYTYGDTPITHPVRQLLLRWNDLAVRGQLSTLFQSLMEESGLIFRLSPQPDWDRIHTNFSQLFEHLECEANRRNLDFRTLLALLDGYRNETVLVKEEADLHQIETEERKVQLMTMHVSKGLQFPIVFIAGGFTRPLQTDYHLFHQKKENDSHNGVERIFDLAKQNHTAHQKEEEDENRRLFYVALTRAQIKLYLPYYPYPKNYLWVGPLSKFVAAAIAMILKSKKKLICMTMIKPRLNNHTPQDSDFKKQNCNTKVSRTRYDQLSLPPMIDFYSRKIHLDSFSSLNMTATYQPHAYLQQDFQPYLLAEKDLDDDAGEIPAATKQLWTTNSELPGGPKVGSMLHDILEQIDYGLVCRNREDILKVPKLYNTINRNMSLYQISSKWREQVVALILAALTTPIDINGSKLILGELKKNQRQHEVEFYFPYIWGSTSPLSDQNNRFYLNNDGYIRGFIDMVFQYKDQYFIADWKSNILSNGYGPKALKESMDHSGYHLQCHIYSLALLRWLKRTFGNLSCAVDPFGGVFYFYLRGMGTGGQNGIFYMAPEKLGPRSRLEEELEKILKRS